ncbi:MAG: hypothetical protein ACYC91_00475 [Solirubrobacteraceae bacterium]
MSTTFEPVLLALVPLPPPLLALLLLLLLLLPQAATPRAVAVSRHAVAALPR